MSPAAITDMLQAIVSDPWRTALVLPLIVLAAPSAPGLEQTHPRHEHQGIIPAYRGAPPRIGLSAEEQNTVGRDQYVRRIEEVDGNVQAVTVFSVNAPAACVWSLLLDFPAYARGLEDMSISELYRRDGRDYYVEFRYRHWLLGSHTYFVRHTYPGSVAGWGTWTLDYDRRSDLDDSVGFWRVEPVKGNADRSNVFYSATVRYRGWAPWWIMRMFVEGTLAETADWVKAYSEERWSEAGGDRCLG